jgi:hypothetical protein
LTGTLGFAVGLAALATVAEAEALALEELGGE